MKWFVVIHTILEYVVFTTYNVLFYHTLSKVDEDNLVIVEKVLLLVLLVLISSELMRLPFRNNYLFDDQRENIGKINYFVVAEGCIYFALLAGYSFVLIDSTFSFHITEEAASPGKHDHTILANTILLIIYIISFPLSLRRVFLDE